MISWQADDPDGDKLVYELAFRGDGEREWKTLKKDLAREQLHDRRRRSRRRAILLQSHRLGPGIQSARRGEGSGACQFAGSDRQHAARGADSIRRARGQRGRYRFRRAGQRLGPAARRVVHRRGPWTPVSPVDGILDSPAEQFRLHIAAVPAGEHLLVIRVADSGNNTGLAKVVLH